MTAHDADLRAILERAGWRVTQSARLWWVAGPGWERVLDDEEVAELCVELIHGREPFVAGGTLG